MNIKDWLYLYNLEEHFALQEMMQRQLDLPPPSSGTEMIFSSTANGFNKFSQFCESLKLPKDVAWFEEKESG